MPSLRGYASEARWRLANGRVRASNLRYRLIGRYVAGQRARFRNWRAGRNWDRGRRDAAERAGAQIRSRTPVYRDRVNPATGRPHRDDARLGRISDQALARAREERLHAQWRERADRLAPRFHPRPARGRSR